MTTSHIIHKTLLAAAVTVSVPAFANDSIPETDTIAAESLKEVTIARRQRGVMRYIGRAENTSLITGAELKRAACCNLGESFTTNPSVDVSYNDAATGARQIKLLGLSGSYVQMLTENFPNFRGAAAPFGLGYVPGPWMQSIQVSKGASSVKNGYESVSGQINVEFKKPQAEEEVAVNGYFDSNLRAEANANANWHINPKLSTGLLLHYEQGLENHDNNGDGFLDMPRVRQVSGMNRWAYVSDNYIMQAGIKFLDENRRSGQPIHGTGAIGTHTPYTINIDTRRWEGFAKNAYIFDQENNGNVALILSAQTHSQDAGYGNKFYKVDQTSGYAQLMLERKFGRWHQLATGASYTYDRYNQLMRMRNDDAPLHKAIETEKVGGLYAQYTLNADTRWLVMAGLRYDYSSVAGSLLTPRVHVKWNPNSKWSLHASAGSGHRTPHVLAENNYLMASSRQIVIEPNLRAEQAWNYGAGVTLNMPLGGKTLNLSGEYYYTHFGNQLVVDLDSNPHAAVFKNLTGKSFSHTVQVEATYPVIDDLTVTAAYRYNDVRTDYGQGLRAKPLTSPSKSLLTVSYAPMMGLWQFDATLAVNGGGRMPDPYTLPDGQLSWQPTFKAYPQLSAQVTRNFRNWAVYIGGENLTNYRQKSPIIDAANPWGTNFDATMVYGPLHGAMAYVGFRYTLKK